MDNPARCGDVAAIIVTYRPEPETLLRGLDAIALAAERDFEDVAMLLWTGSLGAWREDGGRDGGRGAGPPPLPAGGTPRRAIPAPRLRGGAAVAAVAGSAGARPPARRAARLDVLRAITTE